MKKLFLVLMIGLFLSPLQMFADHYVCKKMTPLPNFPVRTPGSYQVDFDLDYYTGDLIISFTNAISGLNIVLERDGVTYLNTTVSLNAGQSYTNSLAGYDEGTYILTMSTTDGLIAQYEITVETD
jgi:hypothetical protein